MRQYSCIIVDDEILAQELLMHHISKIPQLNVVQCCHNAIDAKFAIEKQVPDLLFLDINMPSLSGIDLLKILRTRPATILTTAYSEYALESYELDVIDYLLKPIEFERFFKAINKSLDYINRGRPIENDEKMHVENNKTPDSNVKIDFIIVKADYKNVKIMLDDILYIEAMQKYVRIHTSASRFVTLMSMSQLEDILPSENFARTHRSFIVNLSKINSIQGNDLNIGNVALPISKGQMEDFKIKMNAIGW